jgi:hypothetical protein
MIRKLIQRIKKYYREENSLISDEGWEILAHPEKRILLREAIEHYHKTGSWELLDKINKI